MGGRNRASLVACWGYLHRTAAKDPSDLHDFAQEQISYNDTGRLTGLQDGDFAGEVFTGLIGLDFKQRANYDTESNENKRRN